MTEAEYLTKQAQDAKAAAVTCPATITAAGSAHSFERISVYNGTPGGQE